MLLLSWHSYLIDQMRYSDWIDRGHTRPTHGEWSKYIQLVAEQVELDLSMAEVTRIGTSANQNTGIDMSAFSRWHILSSDG
jgi:lysine/ornithine N-monooxygenase